MRRAEATARPPLADLGSEPIREALRQARAQYLLNARRSEVLGERHCAEPGWNILLDIFISTCTRRRLSVSAVCIGARAPSATALRYIECLTAAGLLERVADSNDGRRTYVELTALGWSKMMTLLEARS